VARLPDGGACPGGSFASALVDLFDCTPIAGATVQALDAQGVPLPGSVTSASDGTFLLCGPPDAGFTPFFSAPGYVTAYFAELQAGVHSSISGISMASQSEEEVIESLLPGSPNISESLILVEMGSDPTCPNSSGWTFSLEYLDGGAVDGDIEAYLGPTGIPTPGLTATTATGAALFYNVDVSSTSFLHVAPSNPDAGACVPRQVTAFYTGRLYVSSGAISGQYFQVP
jgi:hypothetical protein